MLNKRKFLNDKQVQELYKLQQSSKDIVLKMILDRGWVSEKTIHKILRDDFLVEEVALNEFQIDAAIVSLLPRNFCPP